MGKDIKTGNRYGKRYLLWGNDIQKDITSEKGESGRYHKRYQKQKKISQKILLERKGFLAV